MRRIGLAIGVAVLVMAHQWRDAHAQPARGATAPPGMQCRRAIDQAERSVKVPDQLLAAIGRVETGRWDAESNNWHPWPWTINAEGEGRFFETKKQAIAAVRILQKQGVTSIDVGCLQVNLMHHPNAFASLDQAFDPSSNALYAARFLRELFDQTSDWKRAAGLYHSATPQLGADYRRRVLAAWPAETVLQPSLIRDRLAEAWAATLRPKSRPATEVVLPVAQRANSGDHPDGRPRGSELRLATYGHPVPETVSR